MGGRVGFARCRAGLESADGCDPVADRIDGSGYLVGIIADAGRTPEAREIATQDTGQSGVVVFLPVQDCSDVAGYCLLGALRPRSGRSGLGRTSGGSGSSIFRPSYRDLECILVEPNDLASGIECLGNTRTIAHAELEILGREPKRVDDRLLVGKWRAISIGSQSADALRIVDEFVLAHLLAVEHCPPLGLGLAFVEIDKLTGKLAPSDLRFWHTIQEPFGQCGVALLRLPFV